MEKPRVPSRHTTSNFQTIRHEDRDCIANPRPKRAKTALLERFTEPRLHTFGFQSLDSHPQRGPDGRQKPPSSRSNRQNNAHSAKKRIGLESRLHVDSDPTLFHGMCILSVSHNPPFIIMKIKNTPRSGFTLIELLTVIAIIGILAAILIPAVGKVREVANKSTSSSNMRSIAVSYATYSQSGGRTKVLNENRLTAKTYPKTVQGVAQFLGDEVELLDASIWRIGVDPVVIANEPNPPTVGYMDGSTGDFSVNSDFTSSPVSYDFVLGVGGSNPTTTTPLLWTRGLSTAGKWDNETPWGRGGHIAYLDGHVTFYNELDTQDQGLVNRADGKLTVNYEDALPSIAELLKAESSNPGSGQGI